MILPLILLLLAALCAAAVAYGTHPHWAQYSHGVSFILWSRTWQWPLAFLAVLLCLGVVALVVAKKRRAWWLIGLGPVLALFAHRFHSDPLRGFTILENPPLAASDEGSLLSDSDYVIGVVFNSQACAYPAWSLYGHPVVVQNDHDKRMVLIWSAFSDRGWASAIDRDVRGTDLEIVSMPANALLVYNRKFGQFINGVTGRTPGGQKPAGFTAEVPVERMSWGAWRALHPKTRVMIPERGVEKKPNWPLKPWYPMPPAAGELGNEARVILLHTSPPVAIKPDLVTDKPLNLTGGPVPLLVFRDSRTQQLRAFERKIEDLAPKFTLNTNPRRRGPFLIDADTNTGWNADGKALDGEYGRQNFRLKPVRIEEGVYWGVIRFWMPEVKVVEK